MLERPSSVPTRCRGTVLRRSAGLWSGFGAGRARGVTPGREDGTVKTRTLMILALITGLAILVAGAAQIFLGTR